MPIVGTYNNPVLGQAMSNIAQLFAPPSTGEVLAAQQLDLNKQAAAAKTAAIGNLAQRYSSVPGVADALGAGLDVAQLGKLLQLNTAASNPNNLSAQDAVNYANTGTIGGTVTGKGMDPLSSDQVRYTPGMATGGAPSAQYGVLTNGDQTTLLPNGRLPSLVGAPAPTDTDGSPGTAASGMTPGPGGAITIAGPNKPDKMPSMDQQMAAWVAQQPAPVQAKIYGQRAAQGSGNTVNVNTGNQQKIDDAVTSADAEDIKGAVAAGYAAPQTLAQIGYMRAAAQNAGGNLMTGPFAQYALKAKQAIGGALGIDIPGTSDAEIINNIGYGLATQAARAISNRPTQFEFGQALAVKPGLAQSPQGMQALLNIKEQEANDQIALARLAHDPKNLTDWAGTKAAYYASHPIMSPFDPSKPLGRSDIDALNNAALAAAAPTVASENPGTGRNLGQQGPVRVSSPADARKLPSGTQIQLPDGSMGWVP